jgi:prolipoprotein diacylglyceryltransferase
MFQSIIINILAFIVIPLGVFFLLGLLIFYHLNKYGLKNDKSKKAALFFSFVLISISVLIIIMFLLIDWNSVSVSDFIERSNPVILNLFQDLLSITLT